MADPTGGPMQQAVEAAYRAEAEVDFYDGDPLERVKAGLLAAIPYLLTPTVEVRERAKRFPHAPSFDGVIDAAFAAQRDALTKEAP